MLVEDRPSVLGQAVERRWEIALAVARGERQLFDEPCLDEFPEVVLDIASFDVRIEVVELADTRHLLWVTEDVTQQRRLVAVTQILANRRAGDHAFLMKNLPAFTQNFALKFHVLIRRTDYVVGVFEHNRGGHEWEAGALSSPPVRHRTWILKREYPTTEAEHEAFDAMIADFFALIDELGQILLWTDEAELEELAENEIP